MSSAPLTPEPSPAHTEAPLAGERVGTPMPLREIGQLMAREQGMPAGEYVVELNVLIAPTAAALPDGEHLPGMSFGLQSVGLQRVDSPVRGSFTYVPAAKRRTSKKK